MLWELLILAGTVLMVRFHLRKRNLMKGLDHLPVVQWDLPIVGAGYRFLFSNTEQIMSTFIKICEETETPSLFWFGPSLTFFITKPEDLKAVYMSPDCLQKPFVYDFFGGTLGLFNSPTHVWKKDRKAINMTFNNRILATFVPVFNEKVALLVKSLQKHADTAQSFDVYTNISACTLEMVCGTTLGHDIKAQVDDNHSFVHELESLSICVADRIAKFWLHPDWLYRWLSPNYRTTQQLTATLADYATQIRIIKQTEYNTNKAKSSMADATDEFDGERPPQLFVNELLKMYERGEIDLEALDEQLVTMIVGGNETTALTTANVCLILAMFPDVQQRCVDELRSVYGNTTADAPSTLEQIHQLDYMEMVIKETMRLLPVGPFLGRECTAATKLSNCTIPAGSLLILGNYNVHRNRTIWGERANEFDPEHFRPERVAQRHPFSYVPFSGGPRNCVGIKYAWIAVKIMLSGILRRYYIRTAQRYERMRFKWDITLKVAGGHRVYLEERDFGGSANAK